MKSFKGIALLLILFSFSIDAHSQLWRQYSATAQAFRDQNRIDKAIEYYFKAKEELQRDSKWTTDYAETCFTIGLLYYSVRQYAKIEPLFIEVKLVRERVLGNDHPDYISSCNNLAVIYVKMLQYKKAEPLFIEAKNRNEKIVGKNNTEYADNCNSLGLLYEAMGQYEKAKPYLVEAKDIREKVLGKNDVSYAASCNNLAIIYKDLGQNKEAEPLFVEAKNIMGQVLGKQHPDYAAICDGLAGLYHVMGQYDRAELLFIEAKTIREKVLGKDHPDYGRTCLNLSILYEKIGQNEKAESLILEAKNIIVSTQGKENPFYVGACTSLAILYQKMGQYDKAEMIYIEAKSITEKVLGKENPDYASNCNNLAALYYKTGQYAKAETIALESKQIRERVLGKNHLDYASSCTMLASLYLDMGQYEKAESLFIESKNINEKILGKLHPDYAGNCNNLAHIYYEMGQFNKALSLTLEAKQIIEKSLGNTHNDYAEICNSLGLLYVEMGQYDKAESFYLESKNIKEKILGSSHPSYALSCDNLANLYGRIRQFEKAEPIFYEAKAIIEKTLGKEHPDYARCCNNLGNLYKSMRQYKKAEFFYEEARQIWGRSFGKEHLSYAGTCNNLGSLYWNSGDYDKAHDFFMEAFEIQQKNVKKIFQFTSETEKQLYLKEIIDLGKNSLSFNATAWPTSRQGFTYNVSLTNRNLILTSSQQLRLAINNTNDINIKKAYSNWMNLREQLAFWYSKPNVEQTVYIRNLEEQANQMEKELASLSPEFRKGQSQNEIDWKTIQQNLKKNEAAIEFVEFEYIDKGRITDSIYYVALLLTKDIAEPILVQLFEKKRLDSLLNNNYNQSTDRRINELYIQNKSLYDLLWSPLEKYLSGISTVYFAAAGNLFKISFSALSINDQQFLSDKYQLIQMNTTASIIDYDQNVLSAADKIQLYGGIQYDADSATLKQATALYKPYTEKSRSFPTDLTRGTSFKYLPGSQVETEEIKKYADNSQVDVTILSGTNATEESVKALTGNGSLSVLHIATHGFFFPDPKADKKDDFLGKFETSGKAFKQSEDPLFRSGLIFAGANNAWLGKPIKGIEDGILTAYEVSNLYLPNTKLVVLSACETALGDIHGSEGVYGLQRAFKMAGVKNLVMSLWKVPDTETSEFMQLFYKNLFAKQTIESAFYNAQRDMKSKYSTEPYKWAAWILLR